MSDILRISVLVVLCLPALASAAAPQANSLPASQVTATSAKLEATVHSGGEPTTAWFRYAASSPGACDDTFGARVPSAGASVGDGSFDVAFSHVLAGLTPGVTYYYCAIASNASGLSLGTLEPFTTTATPSATTEPVSNLTSGSVVLNGTGNPRGVTATGWFRYASFHPGACNDTFGTRLPSAGGTDLGAGTVAAPFSEPLTGLTPGTTYYACAIVQNAAGTSFGSVLSFYAPSVPQVTTLQPSSPPAATASLRASVNPRGSATAVWFRWDTSDPGACHDSFGTRAPATGGLPAGSGTSFATVSHTISGLQPETTYYYCAVASNAVGTAFGGVLSFTTPAMPVVVTDPPAAPSAVSMALPGQVNPMGETTQAWFRLSAAPGTCSDSFGIRVPATFGVNIPVSNSLTPYSVNASGLQPATTYSFCAVAMSAMGTSYGQVLTFTTPTVPAVTTGSATGITQGTAQLHASGTTGGTATTGWFRYATGPKPACNDSFGTRVPATGGTALGSGTDPVTWTETIPTTAPGTTFYHYCAIASNSEGLSFGTVKTFTSSSAPGVNTVAATQVTGSSAQLNGSANPWYEATEGWFRYSNVNPGSCNDAFGSRVPATGGVPLGAGSAYVPFSEVATGLVGYVTYYSCAIAENPTGKTFGAVQSFTTPYLPVIGTGFYAGLGSTAVTLEAAGKANYAPTLAWFRYSTTDPGACDDSFGTRAPATGGASLGSGNTFVNISLSVSGLQASTTYYYCALAENSEGKTTGSIRTVTTYGPPTVTTGTATGLTTTQAQLNGGAIFRGSSTTGWFRYTPGTVSTCTNSMGTRVPATGGTALGSFATTPVEYSQSLTGLQPGTTYSFCALASNADGLGMGSISTFATAPLPPVVTTTGTGAAVGANVPLLGSANPGGVTGLAWFRMGTVNPGTCSIAYGSRVPGTGGVSLAAGNAAVPFQVTSANLVPGTTYYFCAVASNSAGTSLGAVHSFVAPGSPTVTSKPPVALSGTTATLHATAEPNGAATTGWFRYATTSPGVACRDDYGIRIPQSGGSALGSGSQAVPFSQTVGGLVPGETYYVCAFASNAVGLSFGEVRTLVPPSAPTVLASSASEVTSHGAVLSASALTGDSATIGWFRLAPGERTHCSDNFGTRLPQTGGVELREGAEPPSWSLSVEDLLPGVTYSFCAFASNAVGAGAGEAVTFTAAVDPPLLTTLEATGIGARAATLRGSAVPNEDPTGGWFRLARDGLSACDDTAGGRAPTSGWLTVGSGTEPVEFELVLSDLRPNTRYAFCAAASNWGGASFGEVATFRTFPAAPEVTTLEPELDEEGGLILRGTARSHGSPGLAWFEVHPEDPGTCVPGTRDRLPAAGVPLAAAHELVPLAESFGGKSSGTYYYCAIAETNVTTAAGEVRSFEYRNPGATVGCSIAPSPAAWLLLGALGWLASRPARRRRGPV